MTDGRRDLLAGKKRVIVKLGSMVLAAPGGGVDQDFLRRLAGEMAAAGEREFIIVSSGAILMGLQAMGLREPPTEMKAKQALAAIGQSRLVQAYSDAFARYGKNVGQVLLTAEGLEDRRRFILSRNTLETLIKFKAVPVINENDTVAVDEIRFGDNDILASMVVNLADADLLVILTNTEGLFDKDPRLGDGKLVEVVEEVDVRIVNMAGGPGKAGSGGMSSKVLAAKRTAHMGVPTVIADGRDEGVLSRVINGDPVGTLFLPSAEKLASRKHWIAYSSGSPRGTLVLDDGAVQALRRMKKSLLPAGIKEVLGDFGAGAMVRCLDSSGEEIARGVTSFSSDQVRRIMGRHSDEIQAILGTFPGEEVIHRDDLVISD
jgi:glutamate 5-kinase